jgi:MFS family permease
MLGLGQINAYNFWLVLFVAIGTISTAYGLAIIGSTIGQPNFYAYFNLAGAGETGYGHTSNMIAALNAVNSAGAILGCIYQVWSADKLGRKMTMLIGCAVLILGGAFCAGAVNIAMFIVGRGIAGMVSCNTQILERPGIDEVLTPCRALASWHASFLCTSLRFQRLKLAVLWWPPQEYVYIHLLRPFIC